MQVNFSVVSESIARTYGDAECIVNVERNRRYSFRDYHLLTNRIVNMMTTRLDLRRGDAWLTMLHNDSLSLLSFFTAYKGEACACYTNTTDTLETQAHQIDLVKPKVVFIEAELLPTHHALLKERGLTIVSMDPPPVEFADVLHFWTLLEGVSDGNPDIVHDDRKDCLILRFTGGTTGAPKAVMYNVDNFMASRDLHFAIEDPIAARKARLLHFGLISHASGIVFFPILFKGGCTITMNDRSLTTWCRMVEREKVTATLMVPSMLYRLLEAPEARASDLSSLDTIYYGASPISPTRLKQLRERFGDIFVQLYAGSEHAGAVTCMSKAEHRPDRNGDESHFSSAGRIVPGVEVLIVDREGRRVPHGHDGEIWMRSRATCMGYLGAPEKTAEEFCDGYWKSGDFGRIDGNGYLYVLDRVKDTIRCNDRNVYPSVVEAALSAHPAVMMSAVVGITDPDCGEYVHAEVVLRAAETVDIGELMKFLAPRLSDNDMPRTIGFASSLPLTPVGKVLRRTLRESCRGRAGRT
jgi:acyl-CoA synthetase (AMP-forming)/AMP-acid ligase II